MNNRSYVGLQYTPPICAVNAKRKSPPTFCVTLDLPFLPEDPYDDSRGWMVEEHFAHSVQRGSCRDALRTAKTLYNRIESARARGKNPRACYGRLYKLAWERASKELAVALGTAEEQVGVLVERSFTAAAWAAAGRSDPVSKSPFSRCACTRNDYHVRVRSSEFLRGLLL